MDEKDSPARENYDLGIWQFLRAGWWFLHIVSIIGLFYLGYLFGNAYFR